MTQEETVLKEEPGNPVFAEYAEKLRSAGNFAQALEVCLAGLSANPGCHRGRLVLARIYYEKRFMPFAVQELERLHFELPENKSVLKLLEKLRGDSAESSPENGSKKTPSSAEAAPAQASTKPAAGGTMAEAEFDFDVLDDIEEEEDN